MDKRIVIETQAFAEIGKRLIPLSLSDQIEIGLRQKPTISIQGVGGFKVETNHRHPMHRIALAFQQKIGGELGAAIGVRKNIPPHAGLWSSASASAGVLLILNRLWKVNWGTEKLAKWASEIDPRAARILKILSARATGGREAVNMVLVLPKNIRLDRSWLKEEVKRVKGAPWEIASIHFPDLQTIQAELVRAGASKAGMTGNGPVIYGLFPTSAKPILRGIEKKVCWSWGF